MATTPMVFSSQFAAACGPRRCSRPSSIGTCRGSTCQYRQNFSQQTWTLLPITRFGRAGVQAGLLAALPPPPQQRHAAEHARLARPGGRAAGGRLLGRRVPQVGQDADAARLELRGLRVLILVDHVLGQAFRHQLRGLRFHPGGHERGQVEPGVAVQHQLVPYHLQRGVRQHAVLGQLVLRDGVLGGADVDRVDLQLGLVVVIPDSLVDGHGGSLATDGCLARLAVHCG